MAGEGSLIQKLEEAVNRLHVLEREKSEAVARAMALEQEIKELRGLISVAETKAEEILRSAPVGTGGKPLDVAFPEPVGAGPATVDIKPPTSATPAFQEFSSDKGPMQNPADTRRRYTQVF